MPTPPQSSIGSLPEFIDRVSLSNQRHADALSLWRVLGITERGGIAWRPSVTKPTLTMRGERLVYVCIHTDHDAKIARRFAQNQSVNPCERFLIDVVW